MSHAKVRSASHRGKTSQPSARSDIVRSPPQGAAGLAYVSQRPLQEWEALRTRLIHESETRNALAIGTLEPIRLTLAGTPLADST
jgi:hypothetical protein